MTTQDKNAEIAQWMGAEQYTSYYKFGAKTHPEIFDFGNGKTFKQRQLKYHSDWNWIHQAIEKIEDFYTINGEEIEFRVVQYEDEVLIVAKYQSKRWENIVEVLSNGDGKLKNTHEAVYQFVVWHNAQVKENPKP